jgi:transcriptional regulator with XRE-family HTH domain
VPSHPLTDREIYARRVAVGAAIRDARIEAGLSQAALGERIGRDHKTVSRWETAVTDPRLSDLLRLEAALDLLLTPFARTDR